ncbi:hypothetical protein Pmar_PMAR008957 [Perkinsus marinus ATCC 50983]|uniref:Uncharacterized protein n=1 Tax=Perkinsus marinus (strain ATCC 50983 / TXsc) TaxID=423536 RepID=C5LM45_PERM5|nr:hypothetical protein Pmar_PMAR008957 [Perkinsus marinus ATCC 50983]EER02176.1 hypothetical protein Pmar_PMAR008957 [Perkinsus marinus ATCC 50983]|eukprot:XP_002769458.1 hypothetical protein Pmar_PMAR008957 [Perkinsus marinus ATCC 50983]
MPARQERRAWRVTYNKSPHHHGKFAVKHYVFHDWRYKFTFYNVADPRPVISTVLGSLSGDAAVTCDFAWYFPGTQEYLVETRKTEEAQEDTKELLFQGYEHYLKANYVDMEHRKTYTGATVTITEEAGPFLRMAAHHGRMPAQEIVYEYDPPPRDETRPRPSQGPPEEIETPSLVRPSRCDPSLGEGYVLSMATRIQDDASAIDQRIEALRAEIEKLSRSPPTDHRVRDHASTVTMNDTPTTGGTSKDQDGPSTIPLPSVDMLLEAAAKEVEEIEVFLGLRPREDHRSGQDQIIGPAVAEHIERLYKSALKLLRQTLCLDKHFSAIESRWGTDRDCAFPEILHASEVFSEVIERNRTESAETSGHTEEILRLYEKYEGLAPVLDGLMGTCESLEARSEYIISARRFMTELQAMETRIGHLQRLLDTVR